ncbi:6-phosphogluconate dehydrogenase, decarboxylating-like [Ylistrum balloti]|uniref:6-phosphogluconate dehydrogenase, decarboxylating-like n=1 Tax=Ylistrum balloti TaxID=509963 RepID=UPI0029059B8F|nr:6-phosphogluconate dehydrogenase, decarboxylating-like [Ylistrum balloti]
MIENILPYLDKDDIIIDGGNSYFTDTIRREADLKKKGIRFLGMGVSGGEKGALEGPSLMPGGNREVYDELAPFLLKVAAQDPAPCVDFMGNGGAGHFVKMVHNGIEYADMQLIAEIYDIAKNAFAYSNKEIHELFTYFQSTDLNSYLIDITCNILATTEEDTEGLLINKIKDEAKGKGTGMWTIQESTRLASPVPAISAALDGRYISSNLELRQLFNTLFPENPVAGNTISRSESHALLESTLLTGKILAYAQGFYLLKQADMEYNFNFNFASIAKIWRNGCIIRSTMLDEMSRALENSSLISLVEDEFFLTRLKKNIPALRKVLCLGIESGIPVTALGTSLWYLEALRAKRLPANLIQAQRDFFGAHTYQRIDREGDFHTEWEKL